MRFLAVLFSIILAFTASSFAQAAPLPDGYGFAQDDYGISIRFKGQTVFEITKEPWDPLFYLGGPEDLTGNDLTDVAVLWRSARSQAKFALLEMQPSGLAVLFETAGRPEALEVYRNLSVEDAKALASGEGGPQPDDGLRPFPASPGREGGMLRLKAPVLEEEALPETLGYWEYRPGSWDEGFLAKLGWVEPSISEKNYFAIKFRCPDNGDDIWMEPMFIHETQEEVPDTMEFEFDGKKNKYRLQWQLDDEMDAWVGMGWLPLKTDLFAKLASSKDVTLHYDDEDYILGGASEKPKQAAAIEVFRSRCKLQ